VRIDEGRCDGCGKCAAACAEGAIEIVDGKARVARDMYCDGLGACLGECPRGALSLEDREAEDFDEEAAKRHLAPGGGLPLGYWPIQVRLVSPDDPSLKGASLLLAGDCAAFASTSFHELLKGRRLLVACPKLDDREATVSKLASIIAAAGPREAALAHMDVPCCRQLIGIWSEAGKRAGASVPAAAFTVHRGSTVTRDEDHPASFVGGMVQPH